MKRNWKKTESSKRKRKELHDEIDYLSKKKSHLENDMDELEKEIDIISEKAEANRDIALFIRSNELRKSVKEKKIDIANIETKIEK